MNYEDSMFENNELEAPFLEYLEKYALKNRDTKKKKEQKVKQLMNVKAHLEFLVDNKGKYDLPPIVKKYRKQNIGIIKIKESNKLVRIAFFTKSGNAIVLLGAMNKPKLYEKSKKQKVDKMIEKFLDQMEANRLDYLNKKLFLTLKL